MVEGLPLDGAVRVVELGPGTGAFTAALSAQLGADARALAIDVDRGFIDRLRERWPNIEYVCGNAAALPQFAAERQLMPVDHIISGLPFASLPAAATQDILDAVARTLRVGGTFTTFQYIHAYSLPPAVAFRDELSKRLGAQPRRRFVVWNFPPAHVLRWTRRMEGQILN
jgi:phosphatidylethanolamine/phosphatidyl-N-methylethanolamine N-methyltransferase